MADRQLILGRQIAAGRALAGIDLDRLAKAASIPLKVLRRMETSDSPVFGEAKDIAAVKAALERFGIRFIPENGAGAGVRLKFNRSEVRRIATLEGEGGIVADDDI
ncbi:MAG: XRE family transcriptional regulator [Rhizobiaceae bacterium]